MKPRFVASAVAFLTLALSSPGAAQNPPPVDESRVKQSVATQKRINRYFHSVVLPKLKPCWDRVQGKGTVEIRYRFESAKSGWALKALKAGKSDLPKGQAEAAAACMQKAVTGTAFPREKSDTGKLYVILWDWPVPLPPDTAEQAERMFRGVGGEGSGCDGHGSPPRCVTCSGSPLTCVYVCVGSNTCEVGATRPGGFDSMCTEGGHCASGGSFGVVGAVMY